MATYTFDVLSAAPAGGIPLQDLGIRANVPKWSNAPTNTILTVGYNLSALGLTDNDIKSSVNLSAALTAGYITLYIDGTSIPTTTTTSPADIPSLQNMSGLLPVTKGGTGLSSLTLNSILYASTTSAFSPITGAQYNALVFNAGGVPAAGQINLAQAAAVTGVLAIANGGSGQSTKTAGFNALSPLTTKGDLIGYDGTNNVRLAVGSNNQVLVADSTQASGLRWGSYGRTDTYSWATSTTAHVTRTTASGAAITIVRFIFPGTSAVGTPTSIKVVASKTNTGTVQSFTVRDITNSLNICSISALPVATDPTAIVDMGALANLPANPAVFEIQISRTGSTNVTGNVSALIINY